MAHRLYRTLAVLGLAVVGGVAVAGGSEAARAAFPGVNQLVAFVSDRDGNNEIYAALEGPQQYNPLRLTNNPGSDMSPAWSADGHKIAFTSDRDGNNEVYVMQADGSSQTPLTNDPANDDRPSWSPDGTKIAFQSNRGTPPETHIWVMGADGSAPQDLGPGFNPAWSPDGNLIAFGDLLRNQPSIDKRRLMVMKPDGTERVALYSENLDASEQAQLDPNWSPNGQELAFSSDEGHSSGVRDLWVVERDGINPRRLTESLRRILDPSWSPDGTRIAITYYQEGTFQPPEVVLVPVYGGSAGNFTQDPASDFDPDWQALPPTAVAVSALTAEPRSRRDDTTLRKVFSSGYKRQLTDGKRAQEALRLHIWSGLAVQADLMRTHALIARDEVKAESASSKDGRLGRTFAIKGFTESAIYAKLLGQWADARERGDIPAEERIGRLERPHAIASDQYLRTAARYLRVKLP